MLFEWFDDLILVQVSGLKFQKIFVIMFELILQILIKMFEFRLLSLKLRMFVLILRLLFGFMFELMLELVIGFMSVISHRETRLSFHLLLFRSLLDTSFQQQCQQIKYFLFESIFTRTFLPLFLYL